MNGGAENRQRENAENGRNMTDRAVRAAQAQNKAPETPEILKHEYRFIRLLGEGANAKTYLAEERVSGNKVAIKQLKSVTDFKSYDLFKREVETMRSVNIAGVPKYIDYAEKPGSADDYYIVQEFIEGTAVSELLERRAERGYGFSEEAVWEFARQMGDILWTLETQYNPPIIHRDIKPSNVIMTADRKFYLIDFGAVANPERKSLNSTIAGTQGYMAPEQLMGDCAVQSDYYGLGATMLHMLTGVAPFKIDTDGMQLLFEDVIDARAPRTSDRMRQVLATLLAVRPADRPKNADALQKILRADFGDIIKESYLSAHPLAEKWGSFLSKRRVFRSLLRLVLGVPIALQWANATDNPKRFWVFCVLGMSVLFFFVHLMTAAASGGLDALLFIFDAKIAVAAVAGFFAARALTAYLIVSFIALKICDAAVLSDNGRESLSPCNYAVLWHYEKMHPDDDDRIGADGGSLPSGSCVATIQDVIGVGDKRAYYTAICDGDVYVGRFDFSPDRFDKAEFDRLSGEDAGLMEDFRAGMLYNGFLKGAKVNVLYDKVRRGYRFMLAQNQSDIRMICLRPWLLRASCDGDFL